MISVRGTEPCPSPQIYGHGCHATVMCTGVSIVCGCLPVHAGIPVSLIFKLTLGTFVNQYAESFSLGHQ